MRVHVYFILSSDLIHLKWMLPCVRMQVQVVNENSAHTDFMARDKMCAVH